MYCVRQICEDTYWVGAVDRRLALFENMFPLPDGVSYNSYVILDEKTCLLDTIDASVSEQFLSNVQHVLNGRNLDYMVINHMEPDHCANIGAIKQLYPHVKIVTNATALKYISQFYGNLVDIQDALIVKENDTLALGKHTLTFKTAPFVHWPEVMFTYDTFTKTLFSADAFGSFGSLHGAIFHDECSNPSHYQNEMRRYYTNIVGKYGPQVQAALKKASTFEIKYIAPLHGLIWRNHLETALQLYDTWSKYEPEEKGVLIVYGSMYGNTENGANILANALHEKGLHQVEVHDVSNTDVSYLISSAFKYSHIVLAAPTYNNEIYPKMYNFIHDMRVLNLNHRTFGFIENGTWAPACSRAMVKEISDMKDCTILTPSLCIKSSVSEENLEQIHHLADSIINSL